MSEIWVVFGATGVQGGSVVQALLQDAVVSISIRTPVRNPSAPAAATLRNLGCQIVHGDLDDKDSLDGALKGASGVFVVTANNIDENYYQREFQQGKNIADAAVKACAKKIIFSTLPSVRKITKNHLTRVVHFDVKHDIEQYIRQQPIASSFIALGAFMSNFTTVLQPRDVGDGTLAIKTSMPSSTVLPLIDPTNIGQTVVQIINDFDGFSNKTIFLWAQMNTLDEIAALIGKVNARTVNYIQIPSEEFLAPLPKSLAADWADFALYMSEYGYFGPGTNTQSPAKIAQLTTFEDFLRKNMLSK